MSQRDPIVDYALVGSVIAIVVVVALLFLGPVVSQDFYPPCPDFDNTSGSRPAELRFGAQKAAATSCRRPPEEVTEYVPPPRPLRSPEGALGGGLASIGGQAWQYDDLCEAGTIFDVNLDEWVEVRMALEFPVTVPPSGAPLRSATLSLYHASGNGLDQLALYGYAGNGRIDESDAVVAGVPLRFDAGMLGRSDLDVTALLSPEAMASGWAGFSIQADPPVLAGSGSGQAWECVWEANYPVLTIEFGTGN